MNFLKAINSRWLLVSIMVWCAYAGVLGQKYDYHWILGDPVGIEPNNFGNMDIVFSQNSADTALKDREVEMDRTQTTISDTGGNLLFFSNGLAIYNRNDSIMQNGDSINYGEFWDLQGGITSSYPVLEGIMGLPTDSPEIWNVFHTYFTVDTSYIGEYPWRIYQTRIDMSGDAGLGTVLYKNQTVVQDTLGYYVTACKHANGRDWWILANKGSTNCLYEFLVQNDTVISYGLQCMGGKYNSGDGGQAVFSPDGTKFAWDGYESGITIFDFDRCSGTLSSPVFLPRFSGWDSINNAVDSGMFQAGLAFSPNSRFLYVADTKLLFQFDTWADSILGSIDTIGRYQNPPPDTPTSYGTYFLMQLAPDGKIYMCANNSMRYLHVINQPNEKGDSCNFVNYGFPLPRINLLGVPNYPNYRLGPLAGSPCDTLSSMTEVARANKEKILNIFPNPATDYTIMDYGFIDWNKGQPDLEICNALGQVVYRQVLPMYSGFQKLDISSFASGMYTVYIKRSGGVVATQKLVKQ